MFVCYWMFQSALIFLFLFFFLIVCSEIFMDFSIPSFFISQNLRRGMRFQIGGELQSTKIWFQIRWIHWRTRAVRIFLITRCSPTPTTLLALRSVLYGCLMISGSNNNKSVTALFFFFSSCGFCCLCLIEWRMFTNLGILFRLQGWWCGYGCFSRACWIWRNRLFAEEVGILHVALLDVHELISVICASSVKKIHDTGA